MTRIRAARVIVAAGGFEHPLVFQNNDLPGVFLSEGIQRVIALYGVAPGRRAVVVGNGDRALRTARELAAAGIEIAAVADARPNSSSPDLQLLRESGVTIHSSSTVHAAHGSKRVERVTLVQLDAAGAPVPGSERAVEADLLVLATGWEPNTTLLAQDSHQLVYREELGGFFPAALPSWLFAAGEVNGVRGLDAILLDGTRAGLGAAASLGLGSAADRAVAARPPVIERRPSAMSGRWLRCRTRSRNSLCACVKTCP